MPPLSSRKVIPAVRNLPASNCEVVAGQVQAMATLSSFFRRAEIQLFDPGVFFLLVVVHTRFFPQILLLKKCIAPGVACRVFVVQQYPIRWARLVVADQPLPHRCRIKLTPFIVLALFFVDERGAASHPWVRLITLVAMPDRCLAPRLIDLDGRLVGKVNSCLDHFGPTPIWEVPFGPSYTRVIHQKSLWAFRHAVLVK